jgi:hypothetical protein
MFAISQINLRLLRHFLRHVSKLGCIHYSISKTQFIYLMIRENCVHLNELQNNYKNIITINKDV